MSTDTTHRKSGRGAARGCGSGCGFGCGTFFFVLIVGGLLSLFAAAFGVGVSIGIPFTQSNATLAGAIGGKAGVVAALPSYAQGRVAGNQNFLNGTQTFTIGPAEGALVLIIGRQPGAPVVDLHLDLRSH